MQYISTRSKTEPVGSARAIFNGIAEDGGLYVPKLLPRLSFGELKGLLHLDYMGRAKYILSLFFTDFSKEEIDECVDSAYGSGFDTTNPAPISRSFGGISFLELWHGPTCAFKDMALQILPELMRVAVDKVGGGLKPLILAATSGDTGKAALEGFKNVKNTAIQVFYPQNGVSNMQKLQMSTQSGDNVCVTAIKGNFDDAQAGVKSLFLDEELKAELSNRGYSLSSANSINLGRLIPQIVYYFNAYCDLASEGTIDFGDSIDVAVPTGNFGNILSAYYAKLMGLPIGKLICASNKNNALKDFIRTGKYDRNRRLYKTISPSMDILVASNLERLLFTVLDGDSDKVSELMTALSEKGAYTLPEKVRQKIATMFYASHADDERTLQTIGEFFRETGYLCDTHTAVALACAKDYLQGDVFPRHILVVSTASPYKFARDVLRALEICNELPSDEFEMVEKLSTLTATPIPKPIYELKSKPVRFTEVCDVQTMRASLLDFVGAEK